MVITVLTSIKLYLNLTSNINEESSLAKEFFVLSMNILKVTELEVKDRNIDGVEFLNTCYNQYIKLTQASSRLLKKSSSEELVKELKKKFGEPEKSLKKSNSIVDDSSSSSSV
jgi:hypothetical protein